MRAWALALACTAALSITQGFAPAAAPFSVLGKLSNSRCAVHSRALLPHGSRGRGTRIVTCRQAAGSAFTVQKKATPSPAGFLSKIFSFGGAGGEEESSKEELRAGLKRKLGAAVEMNQGKKSREIVESLLEELVRLNRMETDISGRWRLVWSSQTSSTNPFSTPASVIGGECFQVVSSLEAGKGRVENIVQWPQFGGLILRGGASLRTVSNTKSVITIDSFTLEGGGFRLPLLELTDSADITVNDAPQVKQGSQVVTLKGSTGAQRKLNKREGELELLYSDAEGLRVSRGDNGLLYVYIREARKDMLSKASA